MTLHTFNELYESVSASGKPPKAIRLHPDDFLEVQSHVVRSTSLTSWCYRGATLIADPSCTVPEFEFDDS